MTNAHSETGQMTVCCQNVPLGALSSRSAPSVLVGALFKKFGLFLNTPRVCIVYLVKKCQGMESTILDKLNKTSSCVEEARYSYLITNQEDTGTGEETTQL
jgi:hypothetical protein